MAKSRKAVIRKHRVPRSCCPICGARLSGATGLRDSSRPRPGDVTICLYCAAVLLYDDDMQLRAPDLFEALQLVQDPDVVEAQRMAQEHIKRRRLN